MSVIQVGCQLSLKGKGGLPAVAHHKKGEPSVWNGKAPKMSGFHFHIVHCMSFLFCENGQAAHIIKTMKFDTKLVSLRMPSPCIVPPIAHPL